MFNSKTDNIKKRFNKPLFYLSILTLTGCHTTGSNMMEDLSESKTLDLGNAKADSLFDSDTARDVAGRTVDTSDNVASDLVIVIEDIVDDTNNMGADEGHISIIFKTAYNDSNTPYRAVVDKDQDTIYDVLTDVGLPMLLGGAVGGGVCFFFKYFTGAIASGVICYGAAIGSGVLGILGLARHCSHVKDAADDDSVRDVVATDMVELNASKLYSELV